MLEACNTSFQLHFQVAPEEFARRYNIAQAVAAPVLAAAVNSPLLFGRNLWRETRIALLQQSIDTRSAPGDLREQTARVSFGRQWVRESVLEIFCEDIARFRVLVTNATAEDPFAELAAGNVPQLWALRLHNGTVYRWNRPCYGLSEGRPHLRIEFRALPAGPSVVDEVANAAFWFGLMAGVDDEHGDISQRLDFDVAKENFFAAARHGLAAQLGWVDGETLPADELILTRLLDLARRGLALLRIRAEDADHYLGVLEERVRTQRTGAHWLLGSLRQMGDEGSRAERLAALVVGTAARQRTGEPVASWPLADITEAGRWREHYDTVGRLMSTDLFTVHEDELIDLVAYLMNWRHIKHVPVEDDGHRLVGLVTHRAILRLVAQNLTSSRGGPLAVRDVMQHDVVTCTPDLPSLEAMRLMRRHRISCLPVVNEQGVLVGIITEKDFMGIAGHLLERFFGEDGATG
jgi:CBS domain-containing protein